MENGKKPLGLIILPYITVMVSELKFPTPKVVMKKSLRIGVKLGYGLDPLTDFHEHRVLAERYTQHKAYVVVGLSILPMKTLILCSRRLYRMHLNLWIILKMKSSLESNSCGCVNVKQTTMNS